MRRMFLLTAFIPLFASAQDSLKVTTLREVVVSASRTEQQLIDVPRSVTVIHEDVIRNSVYQSLGDLLNAQSGLYVVGAQQTPGMNQNIFMRGANSNQVAVLVDGVRIIDPSSPNAVIDLSEISLANVERVEVIRGSHSTMYGGAAIGGVINIITKKEARRGFHGDASWQGGTFGKRAWSSTENVDFSYGLKNGVYVKGSLFRQDVNGLNATLPSADNPSFTSDRDDFRKTDGSIGGGFKNNAWHGDVSFKRSHQYTDVDNGAFSDDDNYYLIFDRDLFQYRVVRTLTPALRLTLLGSFSNSERFYENDSSRVSETAWDKSYSSGTYFGKLQTHELQLNVDRNALQAVFGAGVYSEEMSFDNYFFYNDPMFPFESITNYDSLDTRTTTGYVFSQAAYSLGNLRLSGGARLSHHTRAGNFLTFEFSPAYVFGDFLLYGSLSTGFNAPSLYQLFDPAQGFGAYTTRGNADLEPERSLSVEGGLKKEFSSGSFVTLSAYHTVVTQAVEYIYLWEGSKPLDEIGAADNRGDTYINVGEQRASGIEVEGRAVMTRSLSLQGNISLLHTRINVNPEDVSLVQTGGHHVQLYNLGTFLSGSVEQEQVVRRPNFTTYLRLNYHPLPRWTFSASHRYTGKRFDAAYDATLGPYGALARLDVDAYHLVDAGLSWQASKSLFVALQLENILDEDYREVAGFQTRGRSAYVKVGLRW